MSRTLYDRSVSTFPTSNTDFQTLAKSDAYSEHEEFIDARIVPLLIELEVSTYAVNLFRYREGVIILLAVGNLIERVREVLPAQFSGVGIMVAKGRATFKADTSPGVLDHLEVPGIGASIGSWEVDSAGSLGLYVRDRLSSKICFCTCWHCVFGNPSHILAGSHG